MLQKSQREGEPEKNKLYLGIRGHLQPMNLGGGGRGVVVREEGPQLPLRLGMESGA